MARLAIERHGPEEIVRLRRLRDAIADGSREREALGAVLRIAADLGDTGLPSSTPRPDVAQSA
jgi:hypothetical protein